MPSSKTTPPKDLTSFISTVGDLLAEDLTWDTWAKLESLVPELWKRVKANNTPLTDDQQFGLEAISGDLEFGRAKRQKGLAGLWILKNVHQDEGELHDLGEIEWDNIDDLRKRAEMDISTTWRASGGEGFNAFLHITNDGRFREIDLSDYPITHNTESSEEETHSALGTVSLTPGFQSSYSDQSAMMRASTKSSPWTPNERPKLDSATIAPTRTVTTAS